METKLLIAGFGGQGVVLSGELIAYAGMSEGYKVSLVPSYGPEMRGGTANCSVILKSSEIFSPMVVNPNILIAFNQPSLDRFYKSVKENGKIFYNYDLCNEIKNQNGVRCFGIPAAQISKRLGNPKVANVVILGAVAAVSEIIKPESMSDHALPGLLTGQKEKLIDINRKAFQEGLRWAEDL